MDARTQAMLVEAARQRESYANLCVNLRGELAIKDAEIATLKAEVAKLTAANPKKTKKPNLTSVPTQPTLPRRV